MTRASTASPNCTKGQIGGCATSWSAEEMLDGQHQTPKSGHPYPCQNCWQGHPAEKTGRGSLLNSPSCRPRRPGRSRDWTEHYLNNCDIQTRVAQRRECMSNGKWRKQWRQPYNLSFFCCRRVRHGPEAIETGVRLAGFGCNIAASHLQLQLQVFPELELQPQQKRKKKKETV